MTGIFNNRPPKPRYNFVWDIKKVLNYLSKLPDNLSLPIRVISHKLALLLSLTVASRVTEIFGLNIEYLIEFEDKIGFTFHKLTDSWRKGRPLLSVEICVYRQNPNLCVVQAIKSYLQVTQAWRNKYGQKQLLLSTLDPHQEVKKSTVAGRVKTILGSAGIDTNLFTAHSTRAASTSKAKVKGLSLDILKRGNWSNKSTWQKHYHKFVSNESAQFQKSIGLGSLWTEDNGRPVRRIYGTGITGWQNSALDRRKFYDIKFPNFVRPRSGHNKTEILWIKSKYDLMLSFANLLYRYKI